MKRILSPGNVEILAQYAWSNVLLAFDFDGTLAPIVADRDAARMRDATSELFDRICCLYPCAIISGRSREDVMRRVNGAPLRYVVGNHGLEPGPHMASSEAQIAETRPILEQSLAAVQGVDVEDKRFSIAVHYRRARRKRDARHAIHDAVGKLPHPMRIVPGKLVVNVLPARAPHKGDALIQLRETCRADTAVYVGDDATDEDVFALDQPGRLLGIRVGSSRTSSAAYCVPGQRDIDTLLRRLIRLRENQRP
jgi:trehalose 6-phosphate phosphatase